MKIREQKSDDHEKTEKVYHLMQKLFNKYNHEIESALWIGPMIAIMADFYERIGLTFEQFKESINEATDHYKY